MADWNACTNEPNDFFRWLECHPAIGGYLQFVAVVVGLGIAIVAPMIQIYLNAREARTKSTFILGSVAAKARSVFDDIESAFSNLDDANRIVAKRIVSARLVELLALLNETDLSVFRDRAFVLAAIDMRDDITSMVALLARFTEQGGAAFGVVYERLRGEVLNLAQGAKERVSTILAQHSN